MCGCCFSISANRLANKNTPYTLVDVCLFVGTTMSHILLLWHMEQEMQVRFQVTPEYHTSDDSCTPTANFCKTLPPYAISAKRVVVSAEPLPAGAFLAFSAIDPCPIVPTDLASSGPRSSRGRGSSTR